MDKVEKLKTELDALQRQHQSILETYHKAASAMQDSTKAISDKMAELNQASAEALK